MMKKIIIGKLKVLILILAMSVSLIVLCIQLFRVEEKDNSEYKIPNMGKRYEELDKTSQRFISTNVFSVTYPIKDKGATIAGTSWSFYNDSKYWYLMTNYHVVAPIVDSSPVPISTKRSLLANTCVLYENEERPSQDPSIAPEPAPTTPPHVKGGKIFLRTTAIDDHSIYAEVTKAAIIYDRFCEFDDPRKIKDDPNNTELFAAIGNYKEQARYPERYQLDMAMIKIEFNAINITETEGTIKKLYNNEEQVKTWVQKNTYNFKNFYKSNPTSDPVQEREQNPPPETQPQQQELPPWVKPVSESASVPSKLTQKESAKYYIAGYPVSAGTPPGLNNGEPVFSDAIFSGDHTAWIDDGVIYKSTSGTFKLKDSEDEPIKSDEPSAIFNCWGFKTWIQSHQPDSPSGIKLPESPIGKSKTSDDDAWTLTGGASGSPLFMLQWDENAKYYKIANYWTPVAIYWGGLADGRDSRLFCPCFNMFLNDERREIKNGSTTITYLQKYNAFKNCYNFLKSGREE